MHRVLSIAIAAAACLGASARADAQNAKVVLTCHSKHYGTTTYVIDLNAKSLVADNPGGRSETGAINGPMHAQYTITKLTDEEISWQTGVATRSINRYTGVLSSTWNDGKEGPKEQCQKQEKQF